MVSIVSVPLMALLSDLPHMSWSLQWLTGRFDEPKSPGKKRQSLTTKLIYQQGAQDVCQQVGPYYAITLGPKIQMQQTLYSFEGQFNLPAQTVQFQHVGGADLFGGQIGQQVGILRRS